MSQLRLDVVAIGSGAVGSHCGRRVLARRKWERTDTATASGVIRTAATPISAAGG